MIPGLPKINGAVGIAIKGIVAMITGPAKIDGLKEDIAHVKTDLDNLQAEVTTVRVDVGEIKGYIKGHVESHQHGGSP